MKDLYENLTWLEEHGFMKTNALKLKLLSDSARSYQDCTEFHVRMFENERSIYVWRNILEDLWYATQTDSASEMFLQDGVSDGCGLMAEDAVENCIEKRKTIIEALSKTMVEIE